MNYAYLSTLLTLIMMNENLATFTTCTRKKDGTKRKKAMHIWLIYIRSPPASLDCYRNEKCEIPKRSTKFLLFIFRTQGSNTQVHKLHLHSALANKSESTNNRTTGQIS
jgi:hypothetical protein